MPTKRDLQTTAIVETSNVPIPELIRPTSIDINQDFRPMFGSATAGQSAANLVGFFQEKGAWVRFTIEELKDYYRRRKLDPAVALLGLLCPWFDPATEKIRETYPNLVQFGEEFAVTRRFIGKVSEFMKRDDRFAGIEQEALQQATAPLE